ncbi:MAG: amidohydrolase [Planctomycetes bacterium]|nr:amidohydrolase [Planctomycetota bacterium]
MLPPRWSLAVGLTSAFVAVLGGATLAGSSTLFHNARIVTNDGRGTVAKALLVRDGRVAAFGELADLEKRPDAAGAQRFDLGGGVALPGLQDGHVDLGALAYAARALDLTSARTYSEVIDLVQARAKTAKDGEWILGYGWDEQGWDERVLPHHLLLSARVGRNPVFLLRRAGRAALVNQFGLEKAGIAGPVQLTPRAAGGRILEDAEGRPTGVLLDGAVELVRKVLSPVEPSELAAALLRVQDDFLARGWTAVHDHGTRRGMLAALRELAQRGELKLRVVSYLDGNLEWDAAALAGLVSSSSAGAPGAPQEGLVVSGVRFGLDGALASHGAALLDSYADAKDEKGLLVLTEDELAQRVSAVVNLGLQPVFEAEGDRANRLALDLLERVAAAQGDLRDVRPRLESALVLSTKDWPRVPALGVVASLQPVAVQERLALYAERLGPARMRSLCTWRALAPELGRMVFGSGAPRVDADPIAAFATLLDPKLPPGVSGDDALTIATPSADDALTGFTSGPAWAARQENRRGRLKPGFSADLSVFSSDPRAPAGSAAKAPLPRLVIVNGAVVWRAK